MIQQLLTEEQVALLKQLKLQEIELQFKSLTQININIQQEEIIGSNGFNGSNESNGFNGSYKNKNKNYQTSSISNAYKYTYQSTIFSQLSQLVQTQTKNQYQQDFKYHQMKNKLLKYREKSEQIYQVGEFIKQYQEGFHMLVKEKDQLVHLLQDLKGQTSQIVSRQKKLIDLSIGIKECLDYYDFHSKFQFNWPCEISIRQMYQDRLQSMLSSVMDGIQFFSQNTNYASSKKYLGMFLSSRSKILSFIKSFFIKLFNKQNTFISKYYNTNSGSNSNSQPLCKYFDSLYTKSKINFVSAYLMCFPQFKRQFKHIISFAKDQKNLQEQKIKFLQTRQVQIQEFCISDSNISLIRYLQKHNNQIYTEVILKLTSFNRENLHQNLVNFSKKLYDGKSQAENLKNRYFFFTAMIISQFIYFTYYASSQMYETIQFIKSFVSKISQLYLDDLIKYLREIKFKGPFQLCETITKIHEQLPNSIKKLQSGQYQLYIIGNLLGTIKQGENIQYLLQIFNSSYQKIIAQLQTACFNSLPKITIAKDLQKVQENICILIQHIPMLKYCKLHEQNYMISSLDIIVKSIREVNNSISSRYECFAWNLIIFGSIKIAIKNLGFNVVRKQLRLDVNESINIIDKVRSVERTQNLLKYAQDILNVIVTGIPTVNQLTLDFVKYINEHCQQLESRFVKDNLFIYGKNMVQFLQHLNQIKSINEQSKTQKLKNLCNAKVMKSLYNGYILSIQKFISESKQILKGRNKSKVPYFQQNIKLLKSLIKQVYQKLIDFLDTFYVQVSLAAENSTIEFEEIGSIKKRHIELWQNTISFQ